MRVISLFILLICITNSNGFLNDWEFVPKKKQQGTESQQAAQSQPAEVPPLQTVTPADQAADLQPADREAFKDAVKPFTRTNMTKVQARLGTLKRRVVEQSKITEETQKEVQQRINCLGNPINILFFSKKSYRPKVHKQVKTAGDGIHDVNSRANITHLISCPTSTL